MILGALEKERDLRVQSAAELRAALKRLIRGSGASSVHRPWLSDRRGNHARPDGGIGVAALVASVAVAWILGVRHGGTPAREIASIAVLPFADMSQAGTRSDFSDGLSEELLDVLAKISQLRVIGRTSSFQFKGKNEDLRVIAQKLGVDHLLEGSVRKEGNRVRVTAQLIRASDGSHLWSETYDRTLEDVFKVQDEIADAVAQALKVTLLAGSCRSGPASSDAHNLYLEGVFLPRRTKDDYEKAIESFKRALAADGGFAPAWAGLAWVYALQAGTRLIPAESGSKQARDARSAPSDSTQSSSRHTRRWCRSPRVRLGLGGCRGGSAAGPYARSRERRRVVQRWYPGSDTRALRRGHQLVPPGAGRDPLRVPSATILAWLYASLGDCRRPRQLRKLLELRPGIAAGQAHLSKVLLARGQPEAGLAAIEKESSEAWRMMACHSRTTHLGVRPNPTQAPRAHAKILGRMGISDRQGTRVPW